MDRDEEQEQTEMMKFIRATKTLSKLMMPVSSNYSEDLASLVNNEEEFRIYLSKKLKED